MKTITKSNVSYKLVVAKYNENVEWINYMDKDHVIIYDKSDNPIENSISRKNIGREVESFLYYILQNYDNLPDYVIFAQGNPFDHMNDDITPHNFQTKLDTILNINNPYTIPLLFRSIREDKYMHQKSLKCIEYFSFIFDEEMQDIFEFAPGCQYIIPKHIILKRTKNEIANVHRLLLNTNILTLTQVYSETIPFDKYSMCGWTFERLMWYFFSNMKLNKFFNRDSYLITGGCGFIGSNLVNRISDDSNVIIVDNLSTGNMNNITINDNIHFIQGDVLDGISLHKVGYVNGIYHMAAMSKVAPSLGDPNMIDFCNKQNIDGTVAVLKYTSSFNPPIKVIYSASSTYYGMNEIPNKETQYQDCQTPYALSKYCGELQCEMFSRLYNVPTVRLRYFMVFGKNEPNNGPYAVVSGIFIKQKLENKPLYIHGDGSQTRDFVHVDDICTANILAMNNNRLKNDTINVGTGRMISIKELANLISDNQIHIEKRSIDLRATLCDTTKLNELLGWVPSKRIEDYVIACAL
jgi:nucleoside-diphosphate-sugar epimerase